LRRSLMVVFFAMTRGPEFSEVLKERGKYGAPDLKSTF
jgi:hypothetical protein